MAKDVQVDFPMPGRVVLTRRQGREVPSEGGAVCRKNPVDVGARGLRCVQAASCVGEEDPDVVGGAVAAKVTQLVP